jgi:predicted class III extradiol MEMO1 family dioxygenase
MDWKSYYDEELREAKTRDKIVHWLQTADELAAASGRTDPLTVFSFPHAAVDASGPLQARVVAWLYRRGFRRVIALGVMHGSLTPTYQVAANECGCQQERLDAFTQISGAFLPAADRLITPFGLLPVQRGDPLPGGVRMDTQGLLKNEFSLDTFHAILRLAADVYDVKPLTVIPTYIGMTRNPVTGSFDTADVLAAWLLSQWDEETAIVTTGDVVHYGTTYGSDVGDASPKQLAAHFRHRLETFLDLAFREWRVETALQMAQHELKSDQREILPLLVRLVGEGAVTDIEVFELSDYASILDTAPPCLVASALIAYKRLEIE